MRLDKIRTAIGDAISVSVQGIQVNGIDGTEVQTVNLPEEQLHGIACQLVQGNRSESIVAAEVKLYLRISNADVLSYVEPTEFRLSSNLAGERTRTADLYRVKVQNWTSVDIHRLPRTTPRFTPKHINPGTW